MYLNAGKVLEVALADPTDGAEGDDRIVAVSQPALLEMLVSKAAQFDNFSFLRGASVRQLLRHNGRVSGVRVRHENVERDLPAALVIGADGRNSVIRKQAGFTLSHSSPPMDIVWCKLPCPDFWPGVRGYIGRGHLLVAYRTWGDDLQLGWVILKGTFDKLRSQGVTAWIEEMCNHTSADLAAHIRANADRLAHPFLLDVVSGAQERGLPEGWVPATGGGGGLAHGGAAAAAASHRAAAARPLQPAVTILACHKKAFVNSCRSCHMHRAAESGRAQVP